MSASDNAPTPRRERLSSLKHTDKGRTVPANSLGPKAPTKRRACTNASCKKPDVQDIDGNRVCLSCGTLITDSNIVAEVTFGETSAGAAVVQGSFVGDGQRHARSAGSSFRRAGGGIESREQTEMNGREEIRKLSAALRTFHSVEEQAFGIYKLAAANNFIQGRRTRTVAAVCLYVACRRDRTNTILLMDLAEIIHVNVFKLGEVYKDLMKDLWLGSYSRSGVTPVVEVEPLILKFARKLEFGSSTQKVAEDAVKIIKRMNRDWMVTGRRPAGLCGACIILAARMNNFRRTVREVVYVVKVADFTIAKRLEEFKRTRSSTLTVEEFRKFGHRLKKQHDPPAVYEAKCREEKKRKQTQQSDDRETLTDPGGDSQLTSTRDTSEVIEERLRRDADGFAIPNIPIDPTLASTTGVTNSRLPSHQQNSEIYSAESQLNFPAQSVPGPTTPNVQITDSQSTQLVSSNSGPVPTPAASSTRKKRGRPARAPTERAGKRLKPDEPLPLTAQDLLVEEELESEIEKIITDPETLANVEETVFAASQARSKALADQLRGQSEVRTTEDIGEDEFEDDPEVANCVLSPEETAIKERIWVTHNEDWLRAQQAKLLKKTLEEAQGGKKVARRKRKAGRMGDGSVLLEGGTPVLSPADANQRMLKKRSKGFSRLINYDKLNEIYRGFDTTKSAEGSSSGDASKTIDSGRSPELDATAPTPGTSPSSQVSESPIAGTANPVTTTAEGPPDNHMARSEPAMHQSLQIPAIESLTGAVALPRRNDVLNEIGNMEDDEEMEETCSGSEGVEDGEVAEEEDEDMHQVVDPLGMGLTGELDIGFDGEDE